MRLKNWKIQAEQISGYISGSDRYPDGTYIKTSRVITAVYDGEILLIKTQNSVYECYQEDYQGDAEQLLVFIRIFAEDKGGSTHVL